MDQSVLTTGAQGTVSEGLEGLDAKVPATAGTSTNLEAKVEDLITDVNDSTIVCLRFFAVINRLTLEKCQTTRSCHYHLSKIVSSTSPKLSPPG